jgi:hypothetical protein
MILESLCREAGSLERALPRLIALKDAVAWESDLNMTQRLCWYALVRDFKPDVIIELGRGYGNSTTVFTEAAQGLGHTEVHSFCNTPDWWTRTEPAVRKVASAEWFAPLRLYLGDLTKLDFAPIVAQAESVLLSWDAHGFAVAEHVLGHLMPLIATKRHLVICHDIGDNRFRARKPYGGKSFWRGMDHWYQAKEHPAYLNLGWAATIVDQIIPILDFCFRNGIELQSADFAFAEACRLHPELKASLDRPLLEHLQKKLFHFAYLSLNDSPSPYHFPALSGPETLARPVPRARRTKDEGPGTDAIPTYRG